MIIAIDFDGILCTNKFPEIGAPNYQVISLVRQLIDFGVEVILWTCRCENELDAAVKWCEDYGLHFCAVNDNAPSNLKQFDGVYQTPPRKIYADVYVDDHNVEFEYISKTRSYIVAMDSVKNKLERLVHYARK